MHVRSQGPVVFRVRDGSRVPARQRRSSRRGRCTRVPHIRPRGRACCPVWRADRSWDGTCIGSAEPIMYAADAYKYVIVKDRSWDPTRFNAATDLDLALSADPDDVLGSTDSEHAVVLRARRQAAAVSRLVGSAGHAVQHHRLLPEGRRSQGGAGVGTSIQLYMVPGMNHCQGGPGTDNFDRMGGDGGVDQDRRGAEAHRGVARDERRHRSHAAALSVRPGGEVERHGEHQRIGQFLRASRPRWNPCGSICVPICVGHSALRIEP